MRDSRLARIVPLAIMLGACSATLPTPRPVTHLAGVATAPDATRDSRVAKAAMRLCDQEAMLRHLGDSFSRANPGWCYLPTRRAIERKLTTR